MATANLTWDPALGAASYTVEYKLQSAPTWTLFNNSVANTFINIPGLNEGSAYDFRITTNCTSGSAGGVILSGNTPCENVGGLIVGFVGTTATLNWTKKPHAVSYKVEYKLQANPSYTIASGSPLNNTGQPNPVAFDVSGLNPGSAYDFRVTVNCIVGISSGAVTSATSSCVNVTNLQVAFT